jgi:hypothetical protein
MLLFAAATVLTLLGDCSTCVKIPNPGGGGSCVPGFGNYCIGECACRAQHGGYYCKDCPAPAPTPPAVHYHCISNKCVPTTQTSGLSNKTCQSVCGHAAATALTQLGDPPGPHGNYSKTLTIFYYDKACANEVKDDGNYFRYNKSLSSCYQNSAMTFNNEFCNMDGSIFTNGMGYTDPECKTKTDKAYNYKRGQCVICDECFDGSKTLYMRKICGR